MLRKRVGRAFMVSVVAMFFCLPAMPDNSRAEDHTGTKKPEQRNYSTRAIRGRVVWMAEAMERIHGAKAVPEAAERLLAVETPDGRLVPLMEDKRGRSFRRDRRLRGIDVELLVRQYDGSPLAQVIRIYAIKKNGKYEMDYWCEICAITMYELKECDCCQGPIELRQRKAAAPPSNGN